MTKADYYMNIPLTIEADGTDSYYCTCLSAKEYAPNESFIRLSDRLEEHHPLCEVSRTIQLRCLEMALDAIDHLAAACSESVAAEGKAFVNGYYCNVNVQDIFRQLSEG